MPPKMPEVSEEPSVPMLLVDPTLPVRLEIADEMSDVDPSGEPPAMENIEFRNAVR